MAIEISESTDPEGLKLFDSNEQRQLTIRTDGELSPRAVSEGLFCFPVDTACRIETSSITFDQRYLVNVHSGTGKSIAKLEDGAVYELDESVQFVGLDGPMKLYCRIEHTGTINVGIKSIRFTFEEPVAIEIGARSLHKRPAGTITTPPDPSTMMDAVSAMTSALKTDSPERSWPTLRGHPPLIELGEELDIQTEHNPLNTGISIEVPPRLMDLYVVSPLSFYLGAPVEEGTTPTIHTEERTIPLGQDRPFADDVARILKHVFFLDCLVRTEGVYHYDLYERQQLESSLPWDLGELYQASLSTRLDQYLSVSYDLLEPHLPRWPLTAHVPPDPESIELLPFIVNELGIVRPTVGTHKSIDTSIPRRSPARTPASVDDPIPRAGNQTVSTTQSAAFTRSVSQSGQSRSGSTDPSSTFPVVEPDVTNESIEHAWFGDEAPRHASKATIEGYRNQLDRKSRTQHIDILVVCNDARMLDEHDLLDETYGTRDLLPFDVTSRFGVTTDELATLLTEGGYDFLHYIGHATEDGLECTDGELDVRSLESVDLGVFFLNACHSYEQGLALARQGAFAGVATLGDIINEKAVESGGVIARLLNLGFPLRAALEVVSDWTTLGDQYLIVGDGSTDIAQSDGGAPTVVSIEESDEPNSYNVGFQHYPVKEFQIGSVTSPNIETVGNMFLLPMDGVQTSVSTEQLQTYFTWTETPVFMDGTLHWNTEFGAPHFLTNI